MCCSTWTRAASVSGTCAVIRAALTVFDVADWYRHVSLIGRVVSIEDDTDLADIDRLALRYTGKPFRRRDSPRLSAWLEPEQWHAWSGGGPWIES